MAKKSKKSNAKAPKVKARKAKVKAKVISQETAARLLSALKGMHYRELVAGRRDRPDVQVAAAAIAEAEK